MGKILLAFMMTFFLMSSYPVLAQQDRQLVGVQPLDELASADVRLAAVSPDASYLALILAIYRDDSEIADTAFCLYKFNTESQICPVTPDSMESLTALVWSPDSRFI